MKIKFCVFTCKNKSLKEDDRKFLHGKNAKKTHSKLLFTIELSIIVCGTSKASG